MALQLIEGFDNSRTPPGVSLIGKTLSYTAGRIGGLAGRAEHTGSGSSTPGSVATLPTPAAEVIAGVALRFRGVATTILGTGSHLFLSARGDTGQNHVGVSYNPTDQTMSLRRGDGTLLGTSPVPFVLINVWHHFQLHVRVSDTNGYAALYLNGSKLIEVDNVDTRNGGAHGDVIDVRVITLQMSGDNHGVDVDDWYLCDGTGPAPYNAPLGDCRVETLRPNGNGAASDFVGSDGNSVDNWQLVDDVNTTTDYVGSNVPGARDLYALTDPAGLDMGEVLAVSMDVLAAKSDAGDAPGNLNAVARSVGGSVQTWQLAIPAQLATTYQWFRTPVVVADPAGDPWTIARLTGLQVGVEVAPTP